MKPSAIISLFIGILLIIIGIVFCTTADNTAKQNGVNLHESLFDQNGNISNTYSFSTLDSIDVTKIAVTFDNADVTIIGGAESSYIKVENLIPGQFGCFISNRVITVTNHMDLSTIADSASNLRFNGIRQFLDPEILKSRTAKIYVYIDESHDMIKQLSLNLNNCNVKLRNVVGSLDFRLKAKKSDISFIDCSTDSSFYAETDACKLSINNLEFSQSEFKLKDSSLNFQSTLLLIYRLNIASDVKPIKVNGNNYENQLLVNTDVSEFPLIRVTGENSDIDISLSQSIS